MLFFKQENTQHIFIGVVIMSMFSTHKGDIVRIRKSKRDGKLISYDQLGKVILIKNQDDLKVGFGKVTSIVEKEKYYIATLEQTPYDIYYGYDKGETIPYNELKEVLTMLNFTKELTMPIKKESYELDDGNFFEIWANLDTGDLITIETWFQDGEESYNTINLFIPTGNTLAFSFTNDYSGFSSGGRDTCCFNAIWCKDDTPLRYLLKFSSKSKDWNGDHPHLWHYGDGHDFDFSEVLKRIYDCKDDIGTLFNMQIEEQLKRYADFWGK